MCAELILQFSALCFPKREKKPKKIKKKKERKTTLQQADQPLLVYSVPISGAVMCYKKLI
jgi:hypothetical protein